MSLEYLEKYNVVDHRTLRSVGMTNDAIAGVVDCCMLRLARGIYSIVRACQKPAHTSAAVLISDTDWTEYFRATSKSREQNPKYQEHLARLRIVHYRYYRTDDVVSGVSAALLHEMSLYRQPMKRISVVHPTVSSRSTEIDRRRRRCDSDDLCTVYGLDCVRPERTGLDLIAALGPADGMAALESGLRAQVERETGKPKIGMTDPPRMRKVGREIVERDYGPAVQRLARGRKRASAILSIISPLSESYAESRTSFALHQLGLHDFTQQYNVGANGDFVARLDFLHRPTNTILAFDGDQKYADAGADTRVKEGRQQNELLNMGFRIVHLKFSDLFNLKFFGMKLFDQAPQLIPFQCAPTL
ncbi:hypothetical protein [Brevibacterium spongiae]|uniref:DUF559 domain-containing protein n=1 Tax=Brevibacterium spongiae TaxID=2909672 RepID=A0ABY5SR75_9MICO|nr:hypothetical protein [Brevibacterium spongiae]UVI35209.1 hypothetical protein L1F31_13940 [Brevibacterium spongiae]